MAAASSSAIHRRTLRPANQAGDDPLPAVGHVGTSRDASPNPLPMIRFAAVGVIVFLGVLQLWLPATHFRHPSDPHRNWLPLDANASSSLSVCCSSLSFSASVDGSFVGFDFVFLVLTFKLWWKSEVFDRLL